MSERAVPARAPITGAQLHLALDALVLIEGIANDRGLDLDRTTSAIQCALGDDAQTVFDVYTGSDFPERLRTFMAANAAGLANVTLDIADNLRDFIEADPDSAEGTVRAFHRYFGAFATGEITEVDCMPA